MKAYEFNSTFEYPEEFKLLKEYLKKNGRLKVSDKMLESLYKEYCRDTWCAYWLAIDNTTESRHILESFAQWLSEYEIF